jgi:hypothetical protein
VGEYKNSYSKNTFEEMGGSSHKKNYDYRDLRSPEIKSKRYNFVEQTESRSSYDQQKTRNVIMQGKLRSKNKILQKKSVQTSIGTAKGGNIVKKIANI